ncbi:unnamed protein product [Gongylonema pulchrum]|uniref:CUE domain-containing protein n=1 Tax=Gongylonema pulchrum TaxID=637853 RepID=A0A183EA19_9BILA|nr:unnamed protein product [Gongylonema pulchrum]
MSGLVLDIFVPPNTRGRISITVVEAKLVKNYGLVRMDPYCRIRVGNAVFETPTNTSGGKAPKWNRVINAYLPHGVESFYLQIFDERAFTVDQCIAWGLIVLPNGIFNGEVIDDWYQLSGQQQPMVLFTEEEVNELHAMFPTVDTDVIKCILEEKRGNKDATVTAILEMTAEH